MEEYLKANEHLPLFDASPAPAATNTVVRLETEQDRQLQRVTGKIGQVILEFWDTLRVGDTFLARDLHAHCRSHSEIAPASADRVMRDLRGKDMLSYEVVNRRQSLYRKIS